jgi:hypothetical protein
MWRMTGRALSISPSDEEGVRIKRGAVAAGERECCRVGHHPDCLLIVYQCIRTLSREHARVLPGRPSPVGGLLIVYRTTKP